MNLSAGSTASLPAPGAEALAHSERVAEFVRNAMTGAGGSLSFAEFMQHALYAPGLGYYSSGSAKLGPGGDFTTAPEVSPLFGRVLARQCAAVLSTLPEPRVLEFGAGSGALAAEILTSLPRHGVTLTDYSILEVSPELRRRQEQLLASDQLGGREAVRWLDRLPTDFCGVIIANEVADALPVERFEIAGDTVLQHRVIAEGSGFGWSKAAAPPFLRNAVRHLEETLGSRLPDGYVSEISPGLAGWIGDIASSLERGFIFLFDYGVARREYYAPDRHGGWLRCHFRHRAHDDPLVHIGIQDLSAWVDFTSVAEGATDAGLEVAGLVSQAHFLLHGGLDDELSKFEELPTAAQLELSRQVKMLTLPGEMGEHFKCIGLSKNCRPTPAPFGVFDRSHTL